MLKTIGVLPEYQQKKIGGTLIELAKQKAIQLGFDKVIYALMYRENVSRHFNNEAQPLRTYSLFYKEL